MRPLPPRPDVLLLDAGNTLVFLDPSAVVDVVTAAGVALDVEAVVAAMPPAKREYAAWMRQRVDHDAGWFRYVESLLARAGVPSARVPPMARALRTAHDEHNLWRSVLDGVPEALDRLRAAGTRLGVVSNSEGSVEAILVRAGLRSHLELVVDSGLEGVAKPDPEIFRRALARMGVAPQAALYVGDVPEVDADGARAAGIEAVLIDAFDEHPGYDAAARVRSVADLARAWLDQ